MDKFCVFGYINELVETHKLSKNEAIVEAWITFVSLLELDQEEVFNAKLKAATRKEIPSKQFAVPGKRKLPIHDCSHARNAKARLNQTHGLTPQERRTALSRINAKLKKCGAEIGKIKGDK